MSRELKFGQLLAIARVLGERVYEEGKPSIPEAYWKKYKEAPVEVFTKLHTDLMEYSHKFGETEIYLMTLFDEILSEIDVSEYIDEPLEGEYLLGYYQLGHKLNSMIH